MRRLILLLVLAAATAHAQAPADTLITKVAERDTPRKKFLRENPGAVETVRTEDSVHFLKPDGTRVAMFGSGLNYVDADQQIQPVAPELWQTDAGWRLTGAASTIRIVTRQNQDTVQIWNGTRLAEVTTPKLTKVGDFAYTFPWSLITWTLELYGDGWQVTSEPIAASRGVRTYQMPLGSSGLALQPDANGDLVDGTFAITRAVIVRADNQQTPCSAWTVEAKAISFTCDDTSLPAEAYPYVIDPQATFHVPTSADDGMVSGTSGAWPPSTGTGSDTTTSPMTILDTTGYTRRQQIARWDTSSLPDAAVVTGATVLYTLANKHTAADCTVKVDWISPSIWPIGNSDYVSSQSGAAYSVGLSTLTTENTQNSWVLAGANNTNISVTGYSALRLGLYKTTAPTINPVCDVAVYNVEWPDVWPRPQLVVTYSSPPQTVSATPNSGFIAAGTWNTFTFQVSDGDGYADMIVSHLQVSAGPVGTPGVWDANSCYLYVIPASNVLYLRRDDNAEPWLGGYTFGSANFVENSQCRIDYANSTLTNSGTTSTAAVRLLFKPTFSAGGWVKHSYVYVLDAAGASDGWDDYGSWTLVPGGPKLIFVQQ